MQYTTDQLYALIQQNAQTQALQQQIMLQQAQQQQAAQQPQPGIIDQLGNKAGSAIGNKAGDWIQNQIFGEPAPTPGTPATTPAAPTTNTTPPTSGGLTDWLSNLWSGSEAAPVAADSLGALQGGNSALEMAGAIPNVGTAPVSGATMLGNGISSGLGSLGVGAQTAGAIGSTLGTAIPIAGGLYGGYQLYNNLSDNRKDPGGGAMAGAATGAAIGSFVPGIGTLAGALIGGVGGAALGSFGGNKDKDQLARDAVRKQMKETGFLGSGEGDYNLQLADGSMFDIGKDGETKNYNVDFSRAGVDGVVRASDPLAAIMTGGDRKLTSDYAGYFTNAAMSSGDPLENVRAQYAKAGLDHSSAYGNVWNLFNAGKLDAARRDGYLDSLDQAFGVGAYAGTGPQAFDANKPGSGGFAPAVPPPTAPTPEIQKPAVKPLAQGTGLLAPLPQNKPTPAGVQLTPGPRPQATGMQAQQQALTPQLQQIGAKTGKGPMTPVPGQLGPRMSYEQQLQQLIANGQRPMPQKPKPTGLLAPLPNSQGQGRGPIRLQR